MISWSKSTMAVLALMVGVGMAVFGVGASAASAAQFHSVTKTTYYNGNQTSAWIHEVKTGGGKEVCHKVNLTGSSTGEFVGPMDYAVSHLELAPTYAECVLAGIPYKWEFNGCKYDFTPESTTIAAMGIKCPAGKEIVIKVGPTGQTCTMYIGPQTVPRVGLSAQPGPPKTIGLQMAVTGLKSKVVGGGGWCGPVGENENGTISGSLELKGYSDSALTKQINIWTA